MKCPDCEKTHLIDEIDEDGVRVLRCPNPACGFVEAIGCTEGCKL